jgi:hypothetical protein
MYFSESRRKLGVVVHAYNFSTGEVEARRLRVPGQPGLNTLIPTSKN